MSPEYLNECFIYQNGSLIWKKRPRSHFKTQRGWATSIARDAGKQTGTLRSDGYLIVGINGKRMLAHRIVWIMHHGNIPPDKQVDHINHQRQDNRITNLRLASATDNRKNQSKRKDNTSGTTGVYWDEPTHKWRVLICTRGKSNHIGLFKNYNDAVAARLAANKHYDFHMNHGSN